MRLGEPDASGRAAPQAIPGARLSVELDAVVVATGQESLERLVDDFARERRAAAGSTVDPATGQTDNPRVWAGGDLVNGGREVVNAVQDGKVAARVHRGSPRRRRRPGPRRDHPPCRRRLRAPGVSLAVDMAGIRSPNPFWLASAPPTNTGELVMRAFEAGWGGAVWKTLGDPIINVELAPRRALTSTAGA